ncbi:hypothetical protein DID80_03820 [Candidatus Marinamargulisbacteria bacterium SCGC AAA071-K20]|nr:hypothetical protein DID80_03820 [Candidatus Marinamargulisbacteria bacterium SCGC AAA071-K20]
MKRALTLFLLLTLPVWAYEGSNELITVPSAYMQKIGYVEFGTFFDYELKGQSGTTGDKVQYLNPSFFLRTALTNNFEYDLIVNNNMSSYHNFHASVFSRTSKKKTHHNFGLGVKNLGWKNVTLLDEENKTNYLVMNLFMVYSINSPITGSGYHLGVANDMMNPTQALILFGLEKRFLFGTMAAEWNGKATNVGLKYNFKHANLYFSWQTGKPVNAVSERVDRLFSVGISYSTNILDSIRESLVTKKEFNSAMSDVEFRMSRLEQQDELESLVRGSQFLEDLQKSMIDAMNGKNKKSERLPIKRAFMHMQKGLEAYYAGNYQEALGEYKTVTEIMPHSSTAYKRLGSIYFQLKDFDNARRYWEMAIKIDPDNLELKRFVKQLPDQRPLPSPELDQ